jgi:hypothetical protein
MIIVEKVRAQNAECIGLSVWGRGETLVRLLATHCILKYQILALVKTLA